MIDINQTAYEERLIHDAPIFAIHQIEINASVERVCQVATDVENWPKWNNRLINAKIVLARKIKAVS